MTIYFGTFFIAFSTLAMEVTLARLLSVVTWYHLAFFAISTAMLGMTAGAVRVYLRPAVYSTENYLAAIGKACLRYALSVPLTLVLLCLLPLDLFGSAMTPLAFLIATATCALPFYFSGIAITCVLTKCSLPIGRLYASDLFGASLGCLFVLGGLEIFDAPSLILLAGGIGIPAGLCFTAQTALPRQNRLQLGLFVAFVVLAFVNAYSMMGIRPVFVKGNLLRPSAYIMEKWNSFSRVLVYKGETYAPYYWGASPKAPHDPIEQFMMNIDGEASTYLQRFNRPADIEFLRYDVTNLGYYLQRKGAACVIGVGGGRDIQSALLFGLDRVTGVDINPIFIDQLQREFRNFAGIAGRTNVTLVVDDARSYLSRSRDRFSVIQMSMIDTWAATGAGAFSLSENALYTREAWKIFLSRLTDDGFFTVSRWYNPWQIAETGRALSLGVAALLDLGVKRPADHLVLVTTERLCTLLISRNPFSATDIEQLKRICADLQYNAVHLPGHLPPNEILRQIAGATSWDELNRAAAGKDLNYDPPTDENPYFFNMLKLNRLDAVFKTRSGILRGNLMATTTLLLLLACLFVLAVSTVILPLTFRADADNRIAGRQLAFWSGAAYFSLIGCGFMLVEIALIQKLSVFLGHPVYALGILLFTLIASTGVGSFISEKLPITRKPWLFVYPLVMAAAIIGLRFLLKEILAAMITNPIGSKIATAVALIFPVGILLGFFFPTGMKLARQSLGGETPWYWALNGVFGVLCSALAVFISIYLSISMNFYLSAACYAMAPIALAGLARPVVNNFG